MNRSLLTTALLVALSMATALHAQAPALTNADVVRLVAMRVSDQTVIAVIHEATATQFDLSAAAASDLAVNGVSATVIAAMRQPSTHVDETAALERSPTVVRPQTLADAAAEAAKGKHEWSTSTWTGSKDDKPATVASGAPTAPALVSDVTKEPYWRERRRAIDTKLHEDQMADKAALDLFLLMEKTGIRRTDPAAYVKAMNEMKRTSDVVHDDVVRLVPEFYAEGKRAGVPEAWLRPSDR